MSMYEAILRQFRKEGIPQQKEVTENEIKKALDNISAKNAGIVQFDTQVAHQIWNQTKDLQAGAPVKLKDFIGTMVKAENILKQQVQHIQNIIKSQTDPKRRQQLLSDLFSYSQDHRTITIPFGLQQIRQSKQIQQSRLQHSLRTAKSNYFSVTVDQRQESTDLKIVLILTIILLIIELIVMFEKHHFITILGIFLVVLAYVLNYFQKNYVRLILVWNGLSTLLDFVWMIVMSKFYWQIQQNSHRSAFQAGFLKFICVLVGFQIALRIVFISLLIKYRSVTQNVRKKVNIFGLTFLLDAQHTQHNLFMRFFKNNHNQDIYGDSKNYQHL